MQKKKKTIDFWISTCKGFCMIKVEHLQYCNSYISLKIYFE